MHLVELILSHSFAAVPINSVGLLFSYLVELEGSTCLIFEPGLENTFPNQSKAYQIKILFKFSYVDSLSCVSSSKPCSSYFYLPLGEMLGAITDAHRQHVLLVSMLRGLQMRQHPPL